LEYFVAFTFVYFCQRWICVGQRYELCECWTGYRFQHGFLTVSRSHYECTVNEVADAGRMKSHSATTTSEFKNGCNHGAVLSICDFETFEFR